MILRTPRLAPALVWTLPVALGASASTACTPTASTTPTHAPRAERSDEAEVLPPLPWEATSERAPSVETPRVALVGGTVMTATGRTIEDGVVVMDDGVIVAVGSRDEVPVPTDAEVIDVHGRWVTPGIIDTHSHMGVYPQPEVEAHSDGNEATAPTTPQVRAADGFWPQDPALGRAVAAGVTTIQVLPGSANLIGGAGETLKMHPGRTVTEMLFPGAPQTMKMACGENPKRVYGEQHQFPSTRMGNVAGYREAFQSAAEYGRSWERWQHDQAAWTRDHAEGASEPTSGDDEGEEGADLPPEPPARDFGRELLLGAIQGRVLVQMHCYRADEMARMIEVSHEMGFRVRGFHHAVEAYKIRDLLGAEGISISTWADWWGFKLEAFDAIPENLGLLTESGVRGVMHSDSPMLVQRLNQETGKALAAARRAGIDLSDDAALRWLTANAAWTLGIDDRTGTLEAGKMADVVVWTAHPFSVYAHAERVYVDGVLEHLRANDPVGRRSDFELGLDLEPREASSSSASPASASRPAAGLAEARPVERSRARTGTSSPTAYVGVTVFTGEPHAAPMEHATLVVDGGRVISLGVGAAPPGAHVVEAEGLVATPGLIALETPLGLAEIELEPSTRDTGHESSEDAIRAAFTAGDGYNPLSTLIPVARLGGVLDAISTPDGGLVSGTSSWVELAGRDRRAIRREVAALHIDLNDGGIAAVHGARSAALTRLRELFDDARLFRTQRAAFDRAQMRETHVSRLDLERIAQALDGAMPVVVRVSRAADILGVIELGRVYGLRLVVSGAEEGWMVADALAAARVPVIVQPLSDLPTRFSMLHARYDNATLLAAAGVELMLFEPGAWDVHNLRQEAGNAVAWGLDPSVALAAMTSVPARVFGLDDHGVLAAGRTANFVVWSGDPFETSTAPVHLVVEGRELPLRSRQTELRDRYRDLTRVPRGWRGLSAPAQGSDGSSTDARPAEGS